MKHLLLALIFATTCIARDYPVESIRVKDGDTVEALLYLGLDTYKKQSVRLAGVYAPEIRDVGGREATKFLQTLVDEAEVIIIRIPKETYSFRRIIGHLILDGKNAAHLIIEAGHGSPHEI